MSNPSPILIKKYANRRLYNTQTSSYITLEELRKMLVDQQEFTVQDAKTGEDVTHLTLTQMLFDLELKGYSLFPPEFLKQLIRLYGTGGYEMFHPMLEYMAEFIKTHGPQWGDLQKQWNMPQPSPNAYVDMLQNFSLNQSALMQHYSAFLNNFKGGKPSQE